MPYTPDTPLRPDMFSVLAMTRAMIAHGGDHKAFARRLIELAAGPIFRGNLGSAALAHLDVREPRVDRAFRSVLRVALEALDEAEDDADDAANNDALDALDAADAARAWQAGAL